MNKTRRELIKREENRILNIIKNFDINDLKDIKNNVSSILNEEEWAFDNYPENLQNSSRGDAMQEAIDSLNTAIEYLDDIIDNYNNNKAEEDIVDILEETYDELINARLV